MCIRIPISSDLALHRVEVGNIVISELVQANIDDLEILAGLLHHYNGKWGHISEEGQLRNTKSLSENVGVVYSVQESRDGHFFFIISDLSSQVTHVLLDDE